MDRLAAQRQAAERELAALQRAGEQLSKLRARRHGKAASSALATQTTPAPRPVTVASPTRPSSRADDEATAQELLLDGSDAAASAQDERSGDEGAAATHFEPYRPWSWPGGDPWAVEPLGYGYGEDRITAMAVDPYRAFVYIEMTDEAIEEARRRLGPGSEGAWFVIRVYDTTDRIFDGTNANRYFDIAIDRGTRAHYVGLGQPARAFVFEAGLKSAEGYFRHVARSNAIYMPRDAMAEPSEPRFITVQVQRDRPARRRYRSLNPAAQRRPAAAPPSPPPEPGQVATLFLRDGIPFAIELRAVDEAFWLRAERSVGGAWRLVGARRAGGEEVSPEEVLRALGGDISLLGLDDVPLIDVAWRAEGPILFELRELGAGEELRLTAWQLWLKGEGAGAADGRRLLGYLLGGYRHMQAGWVGSAPEQEGGAGLAIAGDSGAGLVASGSGAGLGGASEQHH